MSRLFRLLILLSLSLAGLAFAAGTPAGTPITNVATATYVDTAGLARTIQSNEVVTIVQQVYAVAVLRNSLDASAQPTSVESLVATFSNALGKEPGGSVTFAYTITNPGNGTDTFALSTVQGTNDDFDLQNVQIYRDADCNGVLDPSSVAITSLELAADATACVLVVATLPSGLADFLVANLNLVVASAAGGVTDTDNWSQAIATSLANLQHTKSASTSAPVPGSNVTYTIGGSNLGAQGAYAVTNVITIDGTARNGILVTDVLPTGLPFVSASGSSSLGTPSLAYSTNGGATWTASAPASGVNAVALLIEGAGQFFTTGATYELAIQVAVPLNTPANTSYQNQASVRFDMNGDGDGSDPGETTTGNPSVITVAAVYGAAFGPLGFPNGNAPGDTYASGGYTIVRNGDTQTIATAFSGNTVRFSQTITNTGNATDSYDLSFGGAPDAFGCSFLNSTGITPLEGGVVGPLAQGESVTVVFACSIPPTYTETGAAVTTLTLTATSRNDATRSDTTTNVIGNVLLGYGVLIGNGDADAATPPTTTPVTQNTNPGVTLTFPIEIVNTGQNTDTFTLTGNVPAGWTDGIYPDTNCDGIPDPGSSPVTSTAPLAPGQTACYVMLATPPVGTPPGSYPVSAQAVSTTVGTVSSTITNSVGVNAVQAFTFSPSRSGTAASPGEVIYEHTLRNDGNESATVAIGAVTSSVGFTYEYSLNGTVFSSSLSGIVLQSNGDTRTVFVRVSVPDRPADQIDGVFEARVVTATATYASGVVQSANVTDTTTVRVGVMAYTKSARTCADALCANVLDASGATARPGDFIEYTLTARNTGSAPLTNVRIVDTEPEWTDFVSVSASQSGFPGPRVLYSTNGTTWSLTPPTSIAEDAPVFVAVDTNNDTVITASDVMPVDAQIVVRLVVRVD